MIVLGISLILVLRVFLLGWDMEWGIHGSGERRRRNMKWRALEICLMGMIYKGNVGV